MVGCHLVGVREVSLGCESRETRGNIRFHITIKKPLGIAPKILMALFPSQACLRLKASPS